VPSGARLGAPEGETGETDGLCRKLSMTPTSPLLIRNEIAETGGVSIKGNPPRASGWPSAQASGPPVAVPQRRRQARSAGLSGPAT
jgi:hypothetical protein